MIQVWKIDTNDFFTGESYLVNENADDYIESALEITTPYLVGYVKGKWDWVNKRWIEGAIAEEIAEWDNRNSPTLSSKFEALKTQISETDYQIIKCYEYRLVNKELPYDIELLHNERQTLRYEINQLESQEQGGVDDARNI